MQISNATATAETEVRLVERARRGDEAAIRSLIQQNNRRLYRLASAVLGNALDAEDVIQEAYFRAFSHLDGFRSESGFTTWLTRIALNEALQRLRRRCLRLTHRLSPQAMGQIIGFPGRPASDDPDSAAARRQLREVIEAAVERLPRDLRVVFVLREIEEMSTAETTEQLDCRRRLSRPASRARRRLRDLRPGHWRRRSGRRSCRLRRQPADPRDSAGMAALPRQCPRHDPGGAQPLPGAHAR